MNDAPSPNSAAVRGGFDRRTVIFVWAVAALLLAHAVIAIFSASQLSMTYDEGSHLGSGYLADGGDFRFYEGTGVAQRLQALPLRWLVDPVPPAVPAIPRDLMSYVQGQQILFPDNAAAPSRLGAARAVNTALSCLLGLTVCLAARRVWGRRAALLGLAVYALSPTTLAHAALATTDTTAALMFLWVMLAFHAAFTRFCVSTVLLAGLASALLLLTKFSGAVALPLVAALALVACIRRRPMAWRWRGRTGQIATRGLRAVAAAAVLGASAVVVVVGVWAYHGFRFDALPVDLADERVRGLFAQRLGYDVEHASPRLRPLIAGLLDARLLPEAFVGQFALFSGVTGQRLAYLNGAYATTGWWYFFPLAFVYKTALPALGLMGLGVAAGVRQQGAKAWARRVLPVAVLIVGYGAVVLTASINIGHRHLLPIYPALAVVASAAGLWLTRHTPRRAALVAGLAVMLGVGSVWTAPDHLSFFNRAAGGSARGDRLLLDSSIDWGQDLPRLRAWLEADGSLGPGGSPVYLEYFGTAPLSAHGLDAVEMLAGEHPKWFQWLRPGVYAVSVTHLHQVYRPYRDWTAKHEAAYRQLRAVADRLMASAGDMDALDGIEAELGGAEAFNALMARYGQLRMSRLMQYLAVRTADGRAGNSIRIFRLSPGELHAALRGPPVGLNH